VTSVLKHSHHHQQQQKWKLAIPYPGQEGLVPGRDVDPTIDYSFAGSTTNFVPGFLAPSPNSSGPANFSPLPLQNIFAIATARHRPRNVTRSFASPPCPSPSPPQSKSCPQKSVKSFERHQYCDSFVREPPLGSGSSRNS
jgi:hypothetical protein